MATAPPLAPDGTAVPLAGQSVRGVGSGLAPDVELVGLEDEIGASLPVSDESP